MRNFQPTVSVMLDDRKAKKNNQYPIKLRVTLKGERKYYPLGEDCSKEIWDAVLKPRGGGERVKELRAIKAKYETLALEVIKELKVFNFSEFDKQYLKNRIPKQAFESLTDDVFMSIRAYADKLIQEGRVSTGQSYESLLSSLKRFYPYRKIAFSDVTIEFLKSYENWMLKCGRKDGKPQHYAGIGIYMRNLRYIIGQAVINKFITKDEYPFGKGKYQSPVGSNIKKALNIDQLQAIQKFPLDDMSISQRSRDMYIFTYLCNGMNLKDICLLTWKDVDNGSFYFYRSKTKRTVRQQKLIRVTLTDIAKEIINRWGNTDKSTDAYVFPFLKKGLNPIQIRYAIGTLCKRINSDMRIIASKLGIDANLTTYTARHSYATQMLKNKANIKLIEDGLGHTTLSYTEHYLGELDEQTQREFSNKLL